MSDIEETFRAAGINFECLIKPSPDALSSLLNIFLSLSERVNIVVHRRKPPKVRIIGLSDCIGFYWRGTGVIDIHHTLPQIFPHELFHYWIDSKICSSWRLRRTQEGKELANWLKIMREERGWGDYWGRLDEMAARLFEQWVFENILYDKKNIVLRPLVSDYYFPNEDKTDGYNLLSAFLAKRKILPERAFI